MSSYTIIVHSCILKYSALVSATGVCAHNDKTGEDDPKRNDKDIGSNTGTCIFLLGLIDRGIK